MSASYSALARREWRGLAFGVLLVGLSSFGQTFFIALFGAQVRAEFGLSDGSFGAVYAAATVCSAVTMAWIGGLLDTTGLRRFTAAIAAALALACALFAASANLVTLALALYLLRLAGQGLMVHIAFTAMARALPNDRGKAIGIAALGLPLGEALLPLLAVHGMAAIGWRPLWALQAGVVLLGAALALALLPAQPTPSRDAHAAGSGVRAVWAPLWRDPRFALAMPLMLCSPFVITGFFFHQARLADEKGWSLEWIAAWFVAYGAVRAASLLFAGALIDRLSAVRVLPLLAVPQVLALLVLAALDGSSAVPVYLLLFGLTAALSGTLGTALWAEIYGSARLGGVRALSAACNVVASGVAPVAMGVLIDLGVALSSQALGLAGGVAAAGFVARSGMRRLADRTEQR